MTQATLISIKEARKILGKQSVPLSDAQMTELIINLQVLAKKLLQK